MRLIRTLSAIMVAAAISTAQNYDISGIVVDDSAQDPQSGAVVILERAGLTATTGTDGLFTLTDAAGIKMQTSHSSLHRVQVAIRNALVPITIAEGTEVEFAAYTLQGKMISKVHFTMALGTRSLTIPLKGSGCYLYKLKSGNDEIILKDVSTGHVSNGVVIHTQNPSPRALSKQAEASVAINDIIAVTKKGYLNYRMVVGNSDTSGIQIKLIVCADSVSDIDGNVYHAVKIGNQVWTVENLRTTNYNDSTHITFGASNEVWSNSSTGMYCYLDNTTDADTMKKYGALYNWYAARNAKLAPIGWHMPTSAEWDTMQNYLILNAYNWDGTRTINRIARSLCAKTDWTRYGPGNPGEPATYLGKNNNTGFCALPGGDRYGNGAFSDSMEGKGKFGYWWTATEADDTTSAYYRLLARSREYLYGNAYSKESGLSIRLVRD